MKVYIAMNGSLGCLPDNNEVFTSRKAAEDSLIDMFGIQRTKLAGILRRDGILYFSDKRTREFGAEYCEVAEDLMTKAEFEKYNEQ